MSTIASGARATPLRAAIAAGALALLPVGAAVGVSMPELAMAVLTICVLAIAFERLLAWPSLLAVLVLVILFVPIRRYVLPGDLPFQLEPYRLLVAGIAFLWLCALLVDRRVRIRGTGLEAPLSAVLVATVASLMLNSTRISQLEVETDAIKAVTFFLSFLVVLFMVSSVVSTYEHAEALVRLLVGGAAVIALLAIVESRTGQNVFNHIASAAPFLQENYVGEELPRGRFRARGPAEHPIALSAALVMTIPLGIYLIYTTRRLSWALATGLITIGVVSTVSRTGILMLGVVGIVFFWLRRKETKRLLPFALPLLAAIHFAVPGTLGTLKYYFFPKEGIIQEQRGYRDTGRIGDLAPTLRLVAAEPLGIGYGTRIVTGPRTNAPILDNQWLATLLEIGVVGFAAWVWFFVRVIRRFAARAREQDDKRSWLLVSLTAAVSAYAVGMLTYDAFSFVQVTFLLYILTGMGVAVTANIASSDVPRHARTRIGRA